MRFQTFGEKDKPVAVLIHAMFFDEKMFTSIVEQLKNSHYILLPTLNAHSIDEPTTFYSVSDEAEQIANYLLENKVQQIDILLGTSLGGLIAFELFQQKKVSVFNVFLDGTPFIIFSKLRIKIMATIFKRIAHKSAKKTDRKNVLDILFPNDADEMKKICGNINDESIKNLAFACYSYQLPEKIDLEPYQSVTFLYSVNEKASMCIPTVQKFTNCLLIVKEGYKHCGFLKKEPQAYVKMLTNTEKGD